MTTENWLNLAMIIAVLMTAAATLVAPAVGLYFQTRVGHRKSLTRVGQPELTAQLDKTWFVSMALEVCALLLMIVVAIFGGDEPVNLRAVVIVGFTISLISSGFVVNAITYKFYRDAKISRRSTV
jgi:preprotein translocase subunit SecF